MSSRHNHHVSGVRPRRPVPFEPRAFEPIEGGTDPARMSEAAHLSAAAVVRGGRESESAEVHERLVTLTEREGLEAIAELWAESPAVTLPGALWRLYALRSSITSDPERASALFRDGRASAPVATAVAGVAEPPTAVELVKMADSVLSGAFNGDFDVALERAAAFCRVVAIGQTHHADAAEVTSAQRAADFTKNSARLIKTAEQLEAAARLWRRGELD